MLEAIKDPELNRNLLGTGILVLSVFLVRLSVVRALRSSQVNMDTKRQWVVLVKNTSFVVLLFGLVFVWGEELRTFALSVIAIAAAIVIGTKELILCVLGGVFKAVTRPFKIGDRIELGAPHHIRGDVMNHNFFSTNLFEIGPGKSAHQYTGKTVAVPNSVFLNTSVFNESKSSRYRLHTFSVFRPQDIDTKLHQKALLEAAQEVCGDYVSSAQEYLKNIGEIEGIDAPSAEPRVFLTFPDHDRLEYIVRVPVESLRTSRTEQKILEKYLEKLPKAS